MKDPFHACGVMSSRGDRTVIDGRARTSERSVSLAIGPVEYMVVAFPGNQFKGKIAPALGDLVEKGLIRIIDLAFVIKDAEGNVAGMELEDAGGEVFQALSALTAERGGLLNEADLMAIGEALEPNSSAGILVWEDIWATSFAEAARNAGGVLLMRQTVPHEIVQAALDYAAAEAVPAEA
jgi:hypothetical protein